MPPSTPAPLSESAEFRAYPDTIPCVEPPDDWAEVNAPITERVRTMAAEALAPGRLPKFDDIDEKAIVAALLDDGYDDKTLTGVPAYGLQSVEFGEEGEEKIIDLSDEALDDDEDKTVA